MLERDDRIHFPIIIDADEYTRPWRILQRFFIAGLTFSDAQNIACGIYFTFTRPAYEIDEALTMVTENLDDNEKGDAIPVLQILKDLKVVYSTSLLE